MKRRSLFQRRCRSMLAVDREAIIDFRLLYLNAEFRADQCLQCRTEVLQVIGVQQRISGRIQVRQNDREQRQLPGNVAVRTECLDAIYGVEWHPAEHEEQHNDR